MQHTDATHTLRHVIQYLLMLMLLMFSPTAAAGLFDVIANYYDSRDPCQLKNYPGGVLHADPKLLPSYCGKSRYSRLEAAERKGYVPAYWPTVGSHNGAVYYGDTRVQKVSSVRGGGYLITHLNGSYEYVPESE
jgi:hypothetical protein